MSASPYIDLDTVSALRHPADLSAHAEAARRLAGEASRAGGYWLNGLQRPPHFLRSLRSSPFYEPVEFGWAVKLVQAFSAVRAEAAAARAPPKGASSSSSAWDVVGSRHDAGDRSLSSGGEWRELVLLNGDPAVAAEAARNRKRCPATAALLGSMPAASDMAERGVGECTFSALHGGAHLLPHCGSTNARLTAHLPLIVPDGCEIRVGDEVRQYREGELLIFDDSYEHEVWNRHPTDVRVVLLIRFWHPDIAPAKYAATKRAMRRAVVRHRRNTCLPPLDVSLTPPS